MSADRRSPEMWPSGYGQGFWDAAGDRPDGDGSEGDTGLAGVVEPAQRYAVRDTTGRLWATLVREPNKVFWWEGPDGRPGLGDVNVVDLPLYDSERLRRVGLETPVILTEGPKDCEAVWRAGLPCIGTVTGAASIPSRAVLEVLRDRIVILWPDNDEPGVRHMENVAEALFGIAREIRWLQIPGLGPKAGAADVPTAGIARLLDSYARVTRLRVSTDSTSLREKGESPYSSRESTEATYAREVGTVRHSRAELAELRKGIPLQFVAPADSALAELVESLERIQGRLVRPNQINYLIRCYRVHGPDTVRLLKDLFRDRGTTENLLLALELASPSFVAAETGSISQTPVGDGMGPAPRAEDDQGAESWRCGADLGFGHVPALRADSSVYCGTCHPGTQWP
jgi:hypothetical protein